MVDTERRCNSDVVIHKSTEKKEPCCGGVKTLESAPECGRKPKGRRIIRHRRKRRNSPPPISPLLQKCLSVLPDAYEFEIPKTLIRIKSSKAKNIALQLPEGLLIYASTIADIMKRFGGCDSVSIMGDVTYGACCVDDLGAEALGCDLLVHYGHSCLVPIKHTVVECLYVFVEIRVDVEHFVGCVNETLEEGTAVDIMGTVQFRSAVSAAAKMLNERGFPCKVPQAKPLSPGEVLGCTAPTLADNSTILFLSDGRFHLEAAMIANPNLRALRYDPYSKTLTREGYDVVKMKSLRQDAIHKARSAKLFGVILGTLGRQGNPSMLLTIRRKLRERGLKSFIILFSEIFPAKLQQMEDVDAWVQVACPRLSVDWGHFFTKPLLNTYELEVCLGLIDFQVKYPMDYYKQGTGEWSNYHEDNKDRGGKG